MWPCYFTSGPIVNWASTLVGEGCAYQKVNLPANPHIGAP